MGVSVLVAVLVGSGVSVFVSVGVGGNGVEVGVSVGGKGVSVGDRGVSVNGSGVRLGGTGVGSWVAVAQPAILPTAIEMSSKMLQWFILYIVTSLIEFLSRHLCGIAEADEEET